MWKVKEWLDVYKRQWQDRPEDDRNKMLSDTYDLIKKGKVKAKEVKEW